MRGPVRRGRDRRALGATGPGALAGAAGAIALWSVTARWGHPEDAVAVGLLLYGILSLAQRRPAGRDGWPERHCPSSRWSCSRSLFLPRSWSSGGCPVMRPRRDSRRAGGGRRRRGELDATFTRSPASPTTRHRPSHPVDDFVPHLAAGEVAAGPGRILAIAALCLRVGVAHVRVRPGRRAAEQRGADRAALVDGGLARHPLRARVGDVAYYLWPPLAVALAAAARDWSRLLPVGCTAVGLTFFSQVQWHNPWSWWTPMVAGVALTPFFARPRSSRTRPAAQVLPEPGEQFAADSAP